MKMKRLVFCALTCLASITFAQRTISVNFGSDRVAIDDVDTTVGYAPVPGRYWTDVSNAGNTGGTPSTLAASNLQDGTGVALTGTQLYTCSRGGSWYAGNTATLTGKLLYGYLDDSNGSNPGGFKVTGVPFARYRVIIYRNNDAGEGTTGRFGYHTINGVAYSYVSGVLTAGSTANWGVTRNTQIIVGDNTMVVSGLSGDLTVLTASPGGGVRGCISGFQIEEMPFAGATWKGAATENNWNNETNWWGWPVVGSNLSFVGTLRTATLTNNFTAGTVFSNITFEALATGGNTNWTIAGNAFNLSGNLALKTAQTVTMSTPMALAVSPTISVTNGGTMTLSGVLSGTGIGITKEGQGTLALSVQNTFTGGTTINAGMLNLAGGGGGSGTIRGAVTVYSNAVLRLGVNDSTGYNNDENSIQVVNLIGGTMDCAVGNNQTTVADFYMTGGKIIGVINLDLFNNAASITTYASDIPSEIRNASLQLRQTDIPFAVADGVAAIDLLVGSRIYGTGTLTKSGAGRMVVTNALNAYTAATTINGGIYEVGGIGRLNSGAYAANIIINSGAFSYNSSATQTLSGVISGAGIFAMEGSGLLTLSVANTISGTINITNGTVVPKHANAFGTATVNVSGSPVIDIQSAGTIAPTAALTLSGTPTIRVKYNATQDPVVTSITGTTTLNVDVAGITQTGSYKIVGSSSELGLGNFTFQLINTAPGLESNWTSDASGVYLNVTAAPKVISWKNLTAGDWDTTTSNWTTDGLDSVAFVAGDQVILPNYPSLDAAVLTLKANYTVSGLLVNGNETDYTVALDTGTALETRAFSKTGTGFFTFPGALTVTPGVVTNVTGTVTVGTLTAPGLTLANGASVAVTNDASRILAVTLVTNSTLTIPSAAVVPNNVNVTAGTYPAQAIVRYAGGSVPATTFPFGGMQATFKIEKEVDLGAAGCYLSNGQALQVGNGGLLRVTNDVITCATARLIVNSGGSIITRKISFGHTASGMTSTITQDGGTIEVTGNVSGDNNQSSIMLAHWPSTINYDMNGGAFIADNAQVLMALDGKGYWTISNNAYVRAMGIRIRADGDAGQVTTLNLNGGLVEIGNRGLTTGGPAVSVLNLGGSTIRALTDFNIDLSTATVNLTAGTTSVLDLNGKTVTKASNFAGTGTLCITNTGRIAQSSGYIVNIPNLLFSGTAGLLMKLDNALATSEKFTTGALTLQNNPTLTFTLDLQNKTKLQKQYPLIEASSVAGSLSGAAVVLQNNVSGVTCVLDVQGNTVYAVLSGGNVADPVYWKDLSSGSWDKSTMNWVTNSIDVLFDDDKRVVFDDLAVNAATTVTVTEPVNPEKISFESDATAYTVAGTSRITVPVVSCTGTNATMVTAPLTADLVEILTNTLVTVSEPTSLLKASQIPPNATLAVVPSVLGNVPTGTGILELLSGTYRLTNANFASGTVKMTDVGTRAEYVYNATTPVTSIAGAGTFAFVSTNPAVMDPVLGNPILASSAFTGTLKLESVGQMRINNAAQANWRTTFQNLPAVATLFFGKGVQYFGAPFALKAKLAFEDGAQLTDHFQDAGPSTFGQFRLGAGTTWFSNNVHLGTSSTIRIGSDGNSTVWFKHSITGPGSTIQFGSGYTLVNAALQAEMDCSNSAETLSIRNNGGTGRVTVNAWGASSLGNNLVSETTGSSSSFIVNIGDFATPVNTAVRTVNGSNADDVIALNHASGSLTIDGVSNSTYSGKFTGVGKLVKSGNGTLTLAGNSTFTGGLVLNAGTVVPKHANALGAINNTLTLNNGVLDLSASGVVIPAQTNVVATGTPSIRMNCTNATDMTINGISGVVKLDVVTAGALEGVEYKLINSNTTLSLTNFTVSLTDWTVGFGVLTAKADGIYLSLKRGTMIQFQ